MASTSAQGAGLKWTDVDGNSDGIVDSRDASPYVPALASPIVALGLVALAIANRSSNGATFSSRENTVVAQRPQLRLTITPPP